MATAEHRLISRIIRTGGMEEALDFGITEEDFQTLQCKGVWQHLYSYYRHHATQHSTPCLDAFQEMFSQFVLTDEAPGMTTKALCYEVRKARLTLQLKNAVTETINNADDPVAAAIALRQAAEAVICAGTDRSTDVLLSAHMPELIKTYEMKESGQLQPVFHWPWRPLDDETGGVGNEDYVLFYGRPKSKKSFVLTYLLACAYEQGTRALCYTKEMSPENILLRIASFLGRLPYRETRLGQLGQDEKETLFHLEEYVKARAAATQGEEDLIVLSGRDADGSDGVTWLRAKIKEHKPKIVFVDGLYLMNDDDGGKKTPDWQRVMHISRNVRQLVLELHVPIIATMQANRQAAKHQEAELDEVAYSDAVGQDITQGFRVVDEKGSPTVALICAGSREYQLKGLRIYGIPCTDFSFHSIMSDKEIDAAKRDDAQETEAPKRKKLKINGSNGGNGQLDKMFDEQLRGI